MQLFYLAGACSMVPHVALEWTAAEYTATAVARTELRKPEYLRINPQGSVPCLLDGEFALSQNVAILEYLNELYPKANIFGSSGSDKAAVQIRAQARRWLLFLNADLHKSLSPIFAPARFSPQESSHEAIGAQARSNAAALLAIVETQLSAQQYLAGVLSIADVYLMVIVSWGERVGIDFKAYPHIFAHSATISQLASVQKVRQAEAAG